MHDPAVDVPEALTVRYQISRFEGNDYYRHLLAEIEPALGVERKFARRYALWTVIGLPFFVAGGAALALVPPVGMLPGWQFWAIVGFCAWALFAAHRASRVFPLARFRDATVRILMSPAADAKQYECTVTITPDQVSYGIDDSTHIYKWSRVEDLVEMPGCFVIEFQELEFVIVVPDRVFGSEAERTRFRDCAREFHRRSGFDNLQRIKKLVAESKLSCYVCGYDIAGIGNNECPECGTRLRLFVLQLAAKYPITRTFRLSKDNRLR